ncbi:MAG TPA: amidohydrolase family protein [Bryobacteraceae bacterium]|nr:amidohydrolase family protein [Bryobacteraceae bacterium]
MKFKYKHFTKNAAVSALSWVAFWSACPMGQLAARTLEFDTTEVTQPALTAAPDGRSIVFNLLGHLYRLPVSGGQTTQLTFGPYYDSEPTLSPDGARIAFVSSRDDGSDGNLFLFDIGSGKITQLTHEFEVGMPAWSSDGKHIAYLSYLKREEYPAGQTPGFRGGGPELSTPHTISVQGGVSQQLGEARPYGAIFMLPDGRVIWSVTERAPGGTVSTAIEARTPQGGATRLASVPGLIGKAAALTPNGTGLYYIAGGSLHLITLANGYSQVVAPYPGNQARLAAAHDGSALYAASGAKLWRVPLPSGSREALTWTAHVKMEVAEPLVKKWTPPSETPFPPRAVLSPILSPDGRHMIFMAAGSLWEQAMDGGRAQKLFNDPAFQQDPAYSPNGRQLAYIADDHGKRELRVYDFATRQTRTLVTLPGASWPLFPSWSADGKSLVYQRTDQIADPYRFLRVDAQGGQPVELTQTTGEWVGRPNLSAGGKTLYFTARINDFSKFANVFRLALNQPGAQPEPVTNLDRHVHDGLVSPDGKWLAFRRNTEIWVARMEPRVLKDADFRQFSVEGGRSFEFTADSSAVIYSEGRRVWRKPVGGGRAIEIPVRLMLTPAVAPPLLISHVRLLDVTAGKFSEDESLLIEKGRIRWVGAESGHSIPANVVRLDGGGRFAIPGLADSHVHSAWANQQITEDSLIAYGVTSVRDTGSRLDLINALKDRGDITLLPVPRYFASGDIFEGMMPLWGDAFMEITSKEEAREYVRRWKDLGADFIKLYTSLPWYIKSAAAEEAHRIGMPTVGHGLSIEEVTRSIILGFTSLEHDGPGADDRLKLQAASGVKWDPTRTVAFGFGGEREKIDDPATFDTKFRTLIPEDAVKAARRGGSRPMTAADLAAWKKSLAPLLRASQMGVKLLDGTDALMTSIFFGPSMHWELEYFADADIPPKDLLRMATLGNAETVGANADLGTLEAGKLGDVVILDSNPLEDIRNTMRIWRVVKGGEVFDPARMR